MRNARTFRRALGLVLGVMIGCAGCWNHKEPKNLAVVNSSLYDVTDEGAFRVMVEVINPTAANVPQGGGESEKSPVLIYHAEGSSIREAVSNLTLTIERENVGGQNKVRFLTERFARHDIGAFLDYISREILTNENPLVIIIKDDNPECIYACRTGQSSMIGDYFNKLSINQMHVNSTGVFVTTMEFIRDYYEDGKEPVAGLLQIVQNKTAENIAAARSQDGQGGENVVLDAVYEGLAAFRDNQLVGYMDGDETRVYHFLTQGFSSCYITLPFGDHDVVVQLTGSQKKITADMGEDGIRFTVELNVTLGMVAQAGEVDVTDIDVQRRIEETVNENLRGQVVHTIEKAQREFGSDIFGFGRVVHTQHPGPWRQLKENWNDHFAAAEFDVTVTSTLVRLGEIKEPFKHEVLP